MHCFSPTCLEDAESDINPVNTVFWFNLFLKVGVVMVWLVLSFLLPGVGEGHGLRNDTCAVGS